MKNLWLGGEGPGDLPQWAYLHLVTVLKVPPDSLTGCLSVQKAGFRDGKAVTFVRIYKPLAYGETRRVKDFNSLDEHEDLIQYEGYYEKDSGKVFLDRQSETKPFKINS